MSSRLFQLAREELGLAYAVDASAAAWADSGMLGVYAGCAAGDAAALAELVAGQIRVMSSSLAARDLARGKAQMKASVFMAAESLAARAEQAAGQWLAFGRLAGAEIAAAIDAIGPDDLARVGARLLAPSRHAVAALGPGKAAKAAERFALALQG